MADAAMTEKGLIGTSIAGIAAAVLCCSGPSLGVLLGTAGLWALLGLAGNALLAAAVVAVLAVGYAMHRRRASRHGWVVAACGSLRSGPSDERRAVSPVT